jgi:molecular chaperone GrpE
MDSNEVPNNEQPLAGNTPPASEGQSAPQPSEIDLLNERIGELEKQAAQLKDQLLRKAAEFENYKRRTESETLNIIKYAGENTITQLLPVLDDLTRSLKVGEGNQTDDPFYNGVKMIHGKFLKQLEAQGLKVMETVGKEFNVEYHDALMLVPRSDVAPHTIVEEVEQGYLLHDKVIRHAKVIVSTSVVEEEVKR